MPSLLRLAVILVFVATSASAVTLKKPPRGRGFQVAVGAYSVAVGEDLEVCEYRRLPNPKPVDVARFTLRMPPGAHHFAVWTYGGKITNDAAFPPGPVPSIGCVGIAPDEFIPQLLIPTQSPNTEVRFPPGVALRLDAHEQVFLNPHMRNGSTTAVTPDVRFNVYRARKGTVRHRAEGLTFGNSTDIHIPAGGDQTLDVDWTSPIDMTIVNLSTHQHRRGTTASVARVATDGSIGEPIVATTDWEHPGSVWPKGGLAIAKGDKLRLRCSWHNPESHEVTFGPETTDEMCYAIGFFYRDAVTDDPIGPSGCLTTGRGLLCPFAPAVP